MTGLAVGGVGLRVAAAGDGAGALEAALRERWAGFLDDSAAPDVTLEIVAGRDFSADYHLGERDLAPRLLPSTNGRITLAGAGWFDAARGLGRLDRARHLGEVDALLRLALSLVLPSRGALLLHASAPSPDDRVTVLLGASGAGKSTAAAALGGALSDELVVLHVGERAASASGTPYWRGRPDRRPVAALVHLRRGGPGARRPLHGSAALRAIAPHVVRYVADPAIDRAAFALAARASTLVPVAELSCPEGAAFVPFLRRALAAEERA